MPPAEAAALCLSLHDVAPATWPECRRLLEMLDGIGPLPVTLLAVPDYHRGGPLERDRAFLAAVEGRLARGDEVALHGYHHLDRGPPPAGPLEWLRRQVYTAGEGEFAALAEAEAAALVERGLALMGRLGWPVAGFVAPAWLLGNGARATLARSPLRYTTTRQGIYRLPDWQETRASSLVYSVRAGWRRTLSRGWNARLFEGQRARPLLRISLHPADARHPEVIAYWRRLITRALEGRRPLTKRQWIEGLG